MGELQYSVTDGGPTLNRAQCVLFAIQPSLESNFVDRNKLKGCRFL